MRGLSSGFSYILVESNLLLCRWVVVKSDIVTKKKCEVLMKRDVAK